MKLGFIYDACQQKSFYVKNGVSYDYESKKPYSHVHSVSPSLHMAGWNYPFLWEGSSFLNLSEWVIQGKEFPDEDFDVILYANERPGLDPDTYDLYRTERLQDIYPNAKIFAWFKEIYIPRPNDAREENRIKWLKGFGDNIASHGLSSMKNLDAISEIEKKLERKIKHYISCPINIDGLYDNFYSENKELSIYSYTPNPMYRRVQTLEFSAYLGQKYGIPVKYKPLKKEFAYLTQKRFIETWSPSLFHVNLDPYPTQPGQQAIQVACVGSLNIGGMNESHELLFPETSGDNGVVLEEKFKEYLMDEVKRYKAIEYAWDKVNELYSFDVVRKQLLDLVAKYDG